MSTADPGNVITPITPNEIVGTGPDPATATAAAPTPPKFIRPNFGRMPPELKTLKN